MRTRATLFLLGLTCLIEAGSAAEITLSAAQRSIPAGPVFCRLEGELKDVKDAVLVGQGARMPAQADGEGRLGWWSEPIKAGETRTYTIDTLPEAIAHRVKLTDDPGAGRVDVSIDGKPFTAFNYGKDLPKPFLYPVIGPTGDPVTRDYPMKDTPLEKKNKRQDHHHHRSIWTSHGDVRTKDFDKKGHDFWYDALEKGNAPQRVKGIKRVVSGPVFGELVAEIDWVSNAGEHLFSEERTYRFFCGDDGLRIIDPRIAFTFDTSDVMFADTKEGGLLAMRMAVTMDEQGIAGEKGHMSNSNGGRGMKDCWGKPAAWCDYTGPLNGAVVGAAIFDAPTNFRHPTPWHIRDYGLFAANPFALSQFKNEKGQDGAKTWKKGETVAFNYRILIHKGDAESAQVADAYAVYSEPPRAAVK